MGNSFAFFAIGKDTDDYIDDAKSSSPAVHSAVHTAELRIISSVAKDPLSPNLEGIGLIDHTMTLMSLKGHAKIIDRVYSVEGTNY